MRTAAVRLSVVTLLVLFFGISAFPQATLFNERVTWKCGKEGLPWSTTLARPDGQEEYQLILRPLWALEGGVLALEIVIAHPSEPDLSILGQRKKGVASPFVMRVGELEKGLSRSKFGARRVLQADDVVVDAKIEHRLIHG